jgi:multiple sugar transport system permease protein
VTLVQERPDRTVGHRRSLRPGPVAGIIVLIVAAAIVAAPVLWAVSTSLRTPATSFDNPPRWLPTHADWSNYRQVFVQVPMWEFIANSFFVTGLIVLAQIVTCTMSGYAFAMVRFSGKGALFAVILSTMMVPLQTTIIPVFLLIKYLGLADTRMSLVLPAVSSAFGTFLLRQYFLQMPPELGEAARVDGASNWQVFLRIYMPLALAPMATLAVLTFSAYWNEFYRPLIFLQSTNKFTLPLGLVSLQGNLGTGSVSVVLAGIVLALIPSTIVFLFAQRYFIQGIVAGAFK